MDSVSCSMSHAEFCILRFVKYDYIYIQKHKFG